MVCLGCIFQSILPLLESDLYEVCLACVEGTLSQHLPQFTPQLYTAGVVLASQGYPGSYKKGLPITGTVITGYQVLHVQERATHHRYSHYRLSGITCTRKGYPSQVQSLQAIRYYMYKKGLPITGTVITGYQVLHVQERATHHRYSHYRLSGITCKY